MLRFFAVIAAACMLAGSPLEAFSATNHIPASYASGKTSEDGSTDGKKSKDEKQKSGSEDSGQKDKQKEKDEKPSSDSADPEKDKETKEQKETESQKETEEPKETQTPAEESTPEAGSEKETPSAAETTPEAAPESTAAPEVTQAPETTPAQTEETIETVPETPSQTQEAEQSSEGKTEKPSETPAEETTPAQKPEESLPQTTAETTPQETETTAESSSETETTLGPIIPVNIKIPEFKEDFRFTRVDHVPGIMKDGCSVYTKKNTSSEVVGTARGDTLVYILQKTSGWYFVEAGYVRGYAKTEDVEKGDAAEEEMKRQDVWYKFHDEDEEAPFGTMKPRIGHMMNPAFNAVRTTTMETMTKKIFALAAGEVSIYDSKGPALADSLDGTEGKVVGKVREGGLMYVIENHGNYAYVESGDVRGFINTANIKTGVNVQKAVEEKGEGKYKLASEKIPWQKNKAVYYTVQSVLPPRDPRRQELIQFALQFVGYPYKWGGTNLTGGIDCSGFVQAVYREFGYKLPRTSGAQKNYGTEIKSLADALPGDIICYKGHVALYLGNGQIVHASNSKPYPRGGIKVSKVGIMPVIAIRRVIK